MYIRPPFAVDRAEDLAAMIARAPFASLVVAGGAGLEAAHLPMLYDADAGLLISHLAAGNPLAQYDGAEAMAILVGPHAYVSPGFYPSKAEHGRVVPTWKYEAVHVHGRLECFTDPAGLRAVVAALTDRFEAGQPAPWSVDDAPEAYLDGMLRAIVGVRLHVARIEGVRKLSQNRNAADYAGVVAGLAASERGEDRAVAALMAAPAPN
jgi:transcriptional regulator